MKVIVQEFVTSFGIGLFGQDFVEQLVLILRQDEQVSAQDTDPLRRTSPELRPPKTLSAFQQDRKVELVAFNQDLGPSHVVERLERIDF